MSFFHSALKPLFLTAALSGSAMLSFGQTKSPPDGMKIDLDQMGDSAYRKALSNNIKDSVRHYVWNTPELLKIGLNNIRVISDIVEDQMPVAAIFFARTEQGENYFYETNYGAAIVDENKNGNLADEGKYTTEFLAGITQETDSTGHSIDRINQIMFEENTITVTRMYNSDESFSTLVTEVVFNSDKTFRLIESGEEKIKNESKSATFDKEKLFKADGGLIIKLGKEETLGGAKAKIFKALQENPSGLEKGLTFE